jgi:hypothetical protein
VEPRLDPKIEELVAACAYEFGTERERVKPVLWVVLRDELMQRVEQNGTPGRPARRPARSHHRDAGGLTTRAA